MKQIRVLFFIIFFCSCDKHFTIEEALIKDENLTDHSTRHYISPGALPGLLSTEYYKIKAHLNQDSSYLVLFSHFNSLELEDGVKVKFERDKTRLIIEISVQNFKWESLSEIEDYFLNNKEIDLTVEVKNGVGKGVFVRIWENFIIKNNIIKLERQVTTKETLLADTENIIFYKKGEGLKWGLKLFRSRLIKGVRISPPLL
ncbi:MAG: hypothetical protein OXN83_02310 [Oligoflexia bacterium]|nr:hypothetical protein [Oligoflexia bacterium]